MGYISNAYMHYWINIDARSLVLPNAPFAAYCSLLFLNRPLHVKKFIVILLLLASCTPEEETPVEVSILGKWYYDYLEVNGERTPIVQQDYGCDIDKQDYIEFTPGGGLIMYFYQDCIDGYLYDTYTLESNQITFVSDFNTTVSEIKELTTNTLILEATVDRYQDGTLDLVVNRFTR